MFLIGLFAFISVYLILSGLTYIGFSYRASVRMFSKLVIMTRGSRIHEECVAYPIGGNNLINRKEKETIACCVKRVYERWIDSCNATPQEDTPTQEPRLVDTDLWHVRSFWHETAAGYKESISRQLWNNLLYRYGNEATLLFHNYSKHWGQGRKNTTKLGGWGRKRIGPKTVENVTGEIHMYARIIIANVHMEVRGPIVVNIMKGSKYRLGTFSRAYSTTSRTSNSSQSRMNEESCTSNLGFEKIARLWYFNYNKPSKIFKENLKGLLDIKEIWYASYIKIRSNKGSETPFQTLDRTTKENLDKLRREVMEKRFSWSKIKRVEIPKGNGKTRSLGIPTLNDRVVQEVVRSILEPIYEPIFKRNSHGFRPGRSCHTALKQVNTQFKAVPWYIEGDIKNYFDAIDHNILINILKRKVRDNLVLNLIESALKAGIVFKGKTINHTSGTPQGGILSPLLSNIYLHELDEYMEKLMAEFKGSKEKPKINLEYHKYMNKRRQRDIKIARTIPASDPFDSEYRYIRYVRYADDFLVGIVGSHDMAEKIRDKIRIFLKQRLNLTLSPEKTVITHVTAKVSFLGYLISRRTLLIKQRCGRGRKWVNRKMTIPTMDGNVNSMIISLAREGFCDKEGFARPNFKLLPLPQSEINRRINSIIQGISYWWSIAGNRARGVARISYILRFSAAKLYAAKFKIGSIAKVFAKGGIGLNRPLSSSWKSVVGATDDMVIKWKQSTKRKGKMDNVHWKKSIIPPILYDKYKDIPKTQPCKQKSDWEPEFVKVLRNLEKLQETIKLLKSAPRPSPPGP